MKKQLFPLVGLSLLLSACPSSTTQTPKPKAPTTTQVPEITDTPDIPIEKKLPPFTLELPDGYTLVDDATGDLDKDQIAEKVLVVNTDEQGDMGTERALLVFKNKGTDWHLMHRARGPVLPSEHGGMMGDPFESVVIERGAIVLKHFGGSRSKWHNTHRFRFQQDNWELIGTTLVQELPCEEKETFDYNLASGQVIYSHVQQSCENGDHPQVLKILAEEKFMDKKASLPSMNGFVPGSTYAKHPTKDICFPNPNCQDYIVPMDLSDLVGTYTLGGHHESWALTIQPEGESFSVKYYLIDGMLPPKESMLSDLFTPKIMKEFVVSKDGLISSDLGKGRYRSSAGEATIVFEEIKSHISDQLELVRE